MSVEPSELSTEDWTRWQGHVINGVFPLGRYLGCSDHSGVFLTRSAQRGLSEVAIKLVPADRAFAELQLPRWKRAGSLAHPHLLGMFESGGCQLEGLPYLYTVMEYADQTLAQLLLHRALTDEEAREMLPPILDALAFLHGRNLLQGDLKAANILVVGDQLKLASDTIRRVGEGKIRAHSRSDFPEDRQEGGSTAADIRALGLSLFEALTRSSRSGLGEPSGAVVLPPDFSPAFRDVVTRCLNPDEEVRPSATELLAWVGKPAPAPLQPMTLVEPEPGTPQPAPSQPPVPPPVAPAETRPAPATTESLKRRSLLTMVLWMAVILAVAWTGARLFSGRRASDPPAPAVQSPGGSLLQTPGEAFSAPPPPRIPVPAVSTTRPDRGATTAFAALHEATPDVSPSASRSIRGHIKVWVRVALNQDGSVSDAVAERAGPSRYFERVAVEAARKWTFPPADSAAKRLVQVRFDFSRDGTTAHAVALR